ESPTKAAASRAHSKALRATPLAALGIHPLPLLWRKASRVRAEVSAGFATLASLPQKRRQAARTPKRFARHPSLRSGFIRCRFCGGRRRGCERKSLPASRPSRVSHKSGGKPRALQSASRDTTRFARVSSAAAFVAEGVEGASGSLCRLRDPRESRTKAAASRAHSKALRATPLASLGFHPLPLL